MRDQCRNGCSQKGAAKRDHSNEMLVATPDIIDEYVEAPLFLFHAGKQSFDLGVRRMVAADRDPSPTSLCDRIRSLSDSAGKTLRCAALIAAARDVDGRARFPEREGDASTNAATGPGDHRHSFTQQGHDTLEA